MLWLCKHYSVPKSKILRIYLFQIIFFWYTFVSNNLNTFSKIHGELVNIHQTICYISHINTEIPKIFFFSISCFFQKLEFSEYKIVFRKLQQFCIPETLGKLEFPE